MHSVIERAVNELIVPHSSTLSPVIIRDNNITHTPSNTVESPRRVSFDPIPDVDISVETPTNTPYYHHTIMNGQPLQRTYTQEILREQMKQSFAQKEIKLILSGVISLSVSIGCIVLIAITKGENCALNNGAFAILSAVAGGWLTLLSNVSSSPAKSRSNSVA